MTRSAEAMFTDHRADMLAFATSLLRDRDTAEDVVQDALLRALDAGVEPACTRAWLRVAVRNLALDRLRYRQRRTPAWLASVATSDVADHADAVCASVDASRCVRGALGGLSPLLREAVVARYVHGASVATVAAATRCPVGTVRSRCFNGLAQLRVALT